MMKKIFSIVFLSSAFLVFSGCSNDDEPIAPVELTVVKSNINFDAGGGSGTIEIAEAGVSITAATNITADWCTISVAGNIVTVTVKENTSLEGRSLKVVINADDRKVSVPCSQEGAVFWLKDLSSNIAFPSEGGIVKSAIVSSLPLKIENLPAWITYEVENDSIYFTATAGDQFRQQNIVIKSGNREHIVNACQASYNSYPGSWNFTYTDGEGDRVNEIVSIVKNVEDESYILSSLSLTGTIKVPVTLIYNNHNSSVALSGGEYIGFLSPYYIFSCISDSNAGYYTWSPSAQLGSILTLSEKNTPTLTLQDNGTWGSYNADTYRLSAFSSQTPSGATYLGNFKIMKNIVMTKR